MKCPKCGEEMVLRKFIETWDADGKPCEVYEYPVCEKCKIVWEDFDLETMKPFIEEKRRT